MTRSAVAYYPPLAGPGARVAREETERVGELELPRVGQELMVSGRNDLAERWAYHSAGRLLGKDSTEKDLAVVVTFQWSESLRKQLWTSQLSVASNTSSSLQQRLGPATQGDRCERSFPLGAQSRDVRALRLPNAA